MKKRVKEKEKIDLMIKVIELIHYIFIIVFIFGVILLFTPFRIYPAIYFMVLWIIQTIFNGCPITVEENILLKETGKKKFKTFSLLLIKRIFKINVSKRLYKTGVILKLIVYVSSVIIVIINLLNFLFLK